MSEQATILGHVGAGERIPYSVEPGRDPDHGAVLAEVRAVASELERLGYTLDGELLRALAAPLARRFERYSASLRRLVSDGRLKNPKRGTYEAKK